MMYMEYIIDCVEEFFDEIEDLETLEKDFNELVQCIKFRKRERINELGVINNVSL